ncbi:hypothetical protein I317_03871 [Kwoniella heveanensis CBS 569]|nr:hypothetical protein I317_03871 [Kwoniella heveanensis CBS 569]
MWPQHPTLAGESGDACQSGFDPAIQSHGPSHAEATSPSGEPILLPSTYVCWTVSKLLHGAYHAPTTIFHLPPHEGPVTALSWDTHRDIEKRMFTQVQTAARHHLRSVSYFNVNDHSTSIAGVAAPGIKALESQLPGTETVHLNESEWQHLPKLRREINCRHPESTVDRLFVLGFDPETQVDKAYNDPSLAITELRYTPLNSANDAPGTRMERFLSTRQMANSVAATVERNSRYFTGTNSKLMGDYPAATVTHGGQHTSRTITLPQSMLDKLTFLYPTEETGSDYVPDPQVTGTGDGEGDAASSAYPVHSHQVPQGTSHDDDTDGNLIALHEHTYGDTTYYTYDQ